MQVWAGGSAISTLGVSGLEVGYGLVWEGGGCGVGGDSGMFAAKLCTQFE